MSHHRPVITAWQFYAIAIFQGCLVCFGDFHFYKANQKFGAETVASIRPVSVGTIFFVWCCVEPLLVLKYLQAPLQSFLILLSLFGIVFALTQYCKVTISRSAILFLAPLILSDTIIEVCNKSIMASDASIDGRWCVISMKKVSREGIRKAASGFCPRMRP